MRIDQLTLMLVALAWSSQAAIAPVQPMQVNQARAAETRWLAKPVSKSVSLDAMESTNNWEHLGFGAMTLAEDRAHGGKHSIKLTSPTKPEKPDTRAGRPFGEATARFKPADGDWRWANRISVWVYADWPGFHAIPLLLKLNNAGTDPLPDEYNREGLHYVLLKNGEWNHVVWEIPSLPRDKVASLDLIYRLQGNEPKATSEIRLWFDDLELQQVQADYNEGWNVAPGRIAYSHVGYGPFDSKVAIANAIGGTNGAEFCVWNTKSLGKPALKKLVRIPKGFGSEFSVMDFSEITKPGTYKLTVGNLSTEPFEIRPNRWRSSLEATINLFSSERCGIEVPGIHDVCHADWQATHNGQTIVINGGWHDAGDLSQGAANTAQSAYAMLCLAEALSRSVDRQDRKVLTPKLLVEAQWGVLWLLKTRFDDGYRVNWGTMDYWTDNQIGTGDDTWAQASLNPAESFAAATTEAVAARVYDTFDAAFAASCLKAAKEDFVLAESKAKDPNVELASRGILAAVELFRTTHDYGYILKAANWARLVSVCQQKTLTDWNPPLFGFFYTKPDHKNILHYFHRSHEQIPLQALAKLCDAVPGHDDWIDWYSTLVFYSEYLKEVSKLGGPYGVFPASVYSEDESNGKHFKDQVRQGVQLNSNHYLKMFPAWGEFRGNNGVLLAQAKGISTAAVVRRDLGLGQLAQNQMEWVLGRNPFCQSLMYGVGYDFAPQYTSMSGNIIGMLPVGIQTRKDSDLPYWPFSNCYNYKEVWVHPSAIWLELLHDSEAPAVVEFTASKKSKVEIAPIRAAKKTVTDRVGAEVSKREILSAGVYQIKSGRAASTITLPAGTVTHINLDEAWAFEATLQDGADGKRLVLKAPGREESDFVVKGVNITIEKGNALSWVLKPAPKQPWILVVFPSKNPDLRHDFFDVAP